ncbi:MAG: response regulator [Candidatus Omnitrophota bacterium]|jgi:CheY-like chemotaxis protein
MAKKILVIDDEELIIKSLSKLLEKNGYEVFVTKNSQDALIMIEEEDFDLVLADIRMPGMNGVETITQIYKNQLEAKKKKIPVIFITGYADEEVEEKAKTLEPIAYIYKPFEIDKLLNTIKKALD